MKKLLGKLKKDQRGLTLVELLAVIVILGIVSTIAVVVIGNVIDNSKKDAVVADAQQMIAAAKLYEASGGKIDATNGITSGELNSQGLLGKLIDPWTKTTTGYTGSVTKSGNNYTVTLNGSECKISSTEENLLQKGREACGTGS